MDNLDTSWIEEEKLFSIQNKMFREHFKRYCHVFYLRESYR
jgi:hypothetical protein